MSGPSSRVLLGAITPRFTVPATTVPTPAPVGGVWGAVAAQPSCCCCSSSS